MDAEQAKRIADKYIGRRGGKPRKSAKPRDPKPARSAEAEITMPIEDYRVLRMMAEAAPEFTICESCGAWLDTTADGVHAGDMHGCLLAVTGDDRFASTCRRYRAEWDKQER